MVFYGVPQHEKIKPQTATVISFISYVLNFTVIGHFRINAPEMFQEREKVTWPKKAGNIWQLSWTDINAVTRGTFTVVNDRHFPR